MGLPLISVIVPVYNKKEYLKRCLDSLVLQTLDDDKYEVLVIDNASTDGSSDICRDYAEDFSFFRYFKAGVRGVSHARNAGIKHARGKYLLFVDADDSISETTLDNVLIFFESHEDEVDIVTYPLWYDTDKEGEINHFRYGFLKETGVYDVEKLPHICQTTMNICVKKAIPGKKILFNEDMTVHEDQDYICRHILLKNKIGFVKEARYDYYHNEGSLSSLKLDPLYSFDTLGDFEALVNEYPDSGYLMSLFLYNLGWRLLKDQIFPYFLEGKAYEKALERLRSLIRKIKVSMIMEHPFIDDYHRFFFLRFAGFPVTVLPDREISLYSRDVLLYRRSFIEIVVSKINVLDGDLVIEAFLKDVVFGFSGTPGLFLVSEKGEKIKELSIFGSNAGRYKTTVMTNVFYGFYFSESLKTIKGSNGSNEFTFEVELAGRRYPVSYYFMPFSAISPEAGRQSFEKNGYTVRLTEKNTFAVSESTDGGSAKKRNVRKRIWLYYDCSGVYEDNGLMQFLHDVEIDDGADRFFVFNNDPEKLPAGVLDRYPDRIIRFGSILHKKLILNAEKIITAYIENKNIYPFDINTCRIFAGRMNAEIIYLQHGVLHSSVPWKLTQEESRFDKIVVSSQYETEILTGKYNVPETKLIRSGMPRFDSLDREKKPERRILFAPSWRSYLIKCVNDVWVPLDGIFLGSGYYTQFISFLGSAELDRLLKEYDLYLDVKLHPIFSCYKKYFETGSERIRFADDINKNEERYSLFITDYSSFVFDYVWLKRPVIYFLPDMDEFKAGLNSYRELDLPLEKAFGNYFSDKDQVIGEMERIIRKDFRLDKKYQKRMDDFFFPLKNCKEAIYRAITEDKGV